MSMNSHEDEAPVEFEDKLLPVIQTTVSFAIISRARNMKQLISLLKSLAPLKDEIVLILDNNDETIRNRLAEYADIVIPMPGKGCFEVHSADIFYYCTKDWIFRIDDDETLSANCTRELLERYMSKRLINAWWIPRKWFVDKTHYICSGQWFPDYQLRLFRNIPGILALPRRIHEALRVLGLNEHLDEICLEHWDLLTPREMREKKTAHYNELLPNNGCDSFYLYEDEMYTCMPPPPPELPENCCVAVIPQKMRKELRYCVEITVCATGETAALLAQDDKMFLSYHWYNHDKTIYQWDYPRYHPFAMQEGCFHAVMPLEIPTCPGVYYFQADIVQELVRWFCGSGLLSSEYREVTVE